jgi:hypothetical protein
MVVKRQLKFARFFNTGPFRLRFLPKAMDKRHYQALSAKITKYRQISSKKISRHPEETGLENIFVSFDHKAK